MRRAIDLLVLSDIHLGTYGCKSTELLRYLDTIRPKHIILNGDIIDGWSFRKKYFPKSHFRVIEKLLSFMNEGTKVDYITGNHDEFLRNISDLHLHNLSIIDKLILDIDGKRHWFFHGDVFDMSVSGWAKVVARLGGKGYDLLIYINHVVNKILSALGKEKMSLSKKVKSKVKNAVKYINNFEQTAIDLAIEQNYDVVVCGHIHQPQSRSFANEQGSITYLNSGDWVENLTSLEYYDNQWHLVYFEEQEISNHQHTDTGQLATAELSMLVRQSILGNPSLQN